MEGDHWFKIFLNLWSAQLLKAESKFHCLPEVNKARPYKQKYKCKFKERYIIYVIFLLLITVNYCFLFKHN